MVNSGPTWDDFNPAGERICGSCYWPATNTCLDDIPIGACLDKSYDGGGNCRDGSCGEHEEFQGACLTYDQLSYCSCNDTFWGECDGEFLGSSVNCSDVPFADCAHYDREPCVTIPCGPPSYGDGCWDIVSCFSQCVETFAPILQEMRTRCMEEYNLSNQTDSVEDWCECAQRVDILECTFTVACLKQFDEQWNQDGHEDWYHSCMENVRDCRISGPPGQERAMSDGGPVIINGGGKPSVDIDVPDRSTGESSFPGDITLPLHNPDHAGIYKFTITNKFPYRGGEPSPLVEQLWNGVDNNFPDSWAQLSVKESGSGDVPPYIPKNMQSISLQSREGYRQKLWGGRNHCTQNGSYQNSGCGRPYFNWYDHMRLNNLNGYIVIKPFKHNHEIFHEIADKVVNSPAERYKDDNRQVWAIYRFEGKNIINEDNPHMTLDAFTFHDLEFVDGYSNGNVMFEPTAWCRGHATGDDDGATEWIEGDCGCEPEDYPSSCPTRCRPNVENPFVGKDPCIDWRTSTGPVPATAHLCDDLELAHTCCQRGVEHFFTIQIIPDIPTNMDPQPPYCEWHELYQCEECENVGHGCINLEPIGCEVCANDITQGVFEWGSAGLCNSIYYPDPILPCPPEGPPPYPEPGFCCFTPVSAASNWEHPWCDEDNPCHITGPHCGNVDFTNTNIDNELMQQIETMTSRFAQIKEEREMFRGLP